MTARLALVDMDELEALVARAIAAAMPSQPASDWLTSEDAAKLVGVCTKTLLKLRRTAGLPAHEPAPGLVRFRRSEVEAWMERRR
jgi:excisionase family DNA binding protein